MWTELDIAVYTLFENIRANGLSPDDQAKMKVTCLTIANNTKDYGAIGRTFNAILYVRLEGTTDGQNKMSWETDEALALAHALFPNPVPSRLLNTWTSVLADRPDVWDMFVEYANSEFGAKMKTKSSVHSSSVATSQTVPSSPQQPPQPQAASTPPQAIVGGNVAWAEEEKDVSKDETTKEALADSTVGNGLLWASSWGGFLGLGKQTEEDEVKKDEVVEEKEEEEEEEKEEEEEEEEEEEVMEEKEKEEEEEEVKEEVEGLMGFLSQTKKKDGSRVSDKHDTEKEWSRKNHERAFLERLLSTDKSKTSTDEREDGDRTWHLSGAWSLYVYKFVEEDVHVVVIGDEHNCQDVCTSGGGGKDDKNILIGKDVIAPLIKEHNTTYLSEYSSAYIKGGVPKGDHMHQAIKKVTNSTRVNNVFGSVASHIRGAIWLSDLETPQKLIHSGTIQPWEIRTHMDIWRTIVLHKRKHKVLKDKHPSEILLNPDYSQAFIEKNKIPEAKELASQLLAVETETAGKQLMRQNLLTLYGVAALANSLLEDDWHKHVREFLAQKHGNSSYPHWSVFSTLAFERVLFAATLCAVRDKTEEKYQTMRKRVVVMHCGYVHAQNFHEMLMQKFSEVAQSTLVLDRKDDRVDGKSKCLLVHDVHRVKGSMLQ